jgi:hypothetical protein
MVNNFEEALLNIDVFCKVLVKKMIEEEPHLKPEPIENLLKRKYLIEGEDYSLEDDVLVDIFEDERQVRILARCSCVNKEVKISSGAGYMEVYVGKGRKIKLPIMLSDVSNVSIVKCNNQILEVLIRK